MNAEASLPKVSGGGFGVENIFSFWIRLSGALCPPVKSRVGDSFRISF